MKRSEELEIEIANLTKLRDQAIEDENRKTREPTDGTTVKMLNEVRCSQCSIVAAAVVCFPQGVAISTLNHIMINVCKPAFHDQDPASSPVSALKLAGLITNENGWVKVCDDFYKKKVLSELVNPALKKEVKVAIEALP
jgi:hypothetical protein